MIIGGWDQDKILDFGVQNLSICDLRYRSALKGFRRRPLRDPVNAVLSYGYVIVGSEIQALLDGVGFDPYLGFYHAVAYGRPGLALDLLEEFRHPLVDRLALNLFNRGILTQEDFVDRGKNGVYLNSSGKRKFFVHYEKMLGKPSVLNAGMGTTFRAVFQQQIAALMKTVLEGIPYHPFNAKTTE